MCIVSYLESTDNISAIIVELPGLKFGGASQGGVAARRQIREANVTTNKPNRGIQNFSKFAEVYAEDEDVDDTYDSNTDGTRENVEDENADGLSEDYRALVQRFYESGNLEAFQSDRAFLDLDEASDYSDEEEQPHDTEVYDTDHGIEEVVDEEEDNQKEGNNDTI